ncbi:endonuclease V [Aquabacterium humicola]|uniref:endonuclease V n=1 Tax=Aquabacterium humicola TaxID=3237377 RepID=UPI0025437B93|nr:endonuclease V [Rubrivivax pictus]
MKLAAAVHLKDDVAWAAAVTFDEWDAREALRTVTSRIDGLEKPAPGELDLREAAALAQLLGRHGLQPDTIVIDGPVHIDAAETPGWGRALFDALGGRIPIIGISAAALRGLPAQFEVHREEEGRPVLVTCAGLDLGAAKARVRTMHGKRRMPTLLKLAARTARDAADPA